MFCPRCGSQLPDGAKFCASCGAQLGEKSVGPAPAPKPKRRRAPVVAAVVALVALLAGGGVASWWFLLRPEPVYVCTRVDVAEMDAWTTGYYSLGIYEAVRSACPECRPVSLLDLDYELNVQGAIESVALYDSDGSKVLDCEGVLDGHGNTVSLEGAPEDAASYEVAYDGMGRPVRIDVSDGGDNGGRFEYAYSEDGSYTVDRFGPDGEKVWTRSYDTEGTVLSTTVGDRFDLVYEDGFLASCNGEDCQIERDDQGRVVAMTLPSGVWGPLTEAYCDVYGYANYPHWITTICFEYDGNGNISRVYAPWTEEGKKSILSYFSYGGEDEMSLDEMQLGENIFDIRLSYEAIDAPTPLVRTLGGNVFDGSVDPRLGY